MTPERIDELIAMAAMGELSPDDERELEAVTRDDPVLAAEVDEALAAAASVQGLGADAPPAALRAQVMSAIAETPQEETPSAGRSVSATLDDEPVPVASIADERTRRRRLLPVLLGAAAAIVFVIGAFIVSNEAAAPDQYAAIIDASDAEAHSVEGELGTLVVTYSESQSAMVVVADGIAPLGGDETYQLWVDIDGHMTSAGLFQPDDDGHVEQRIDGVDSTGSSINVTAEPAGGSESPTLPVLATSA